MVMCNIEEWQLSRIYSPMIHRPNPWHHDIGCILCYNFHFPLIFDGNVHCSTCSTTIFTTSCDIFPIKTVSWLKHNKCDTAELKITVEVTTNGTLFPLLVILTWMMSWWTKLTWYHAISINFLEFDIKWWCYIYSSFR